MIKSGQSGASTTAGISGTASLSTVSNKKLATNEQLEDIGTSGGDWADDDVQIEGDEDNMNRESMTSNQDEPGEGWGDTDLELPPDLVRKK